MTVDICESCGKPWFPCDGPACIECDESLTSMYNIHWIKILLNSSMLRAGVFYPEFYMCSEGTKTQRQLVNGGILLDELVLPEFIGSGSVNGIRKKFAAIVRQRISIGEINEIKSITDSQDADYGLIITSSDSKDFVDWISNGNKNILSTSKYGKIFVGQFNPHNKKIERWSPMLSLK